MHKDAKTQDLHSNEKIIDNLLKCLSYEITRNFTLLQKNWNCPFAEQTLNVCIIWNISLAVLSDKMTAQTMKRQKFFQTHPILILLHFLMNSNDQKYFLITFHIFLGKKLGIHGCEKIFARVCLHLFSIQINQNFVRNETLEIYYHSTDRISKSFLTPHLP